MRFLQLVDHGVDTPNNLLRRHPFFIDELQHILIALLIIKTMNYPNPMATSFRLVMVG